MARPAVRRLDVACCALAAVLVGASLVWPFYGWEGLRTWAPLFALAGLIACALALVRPWRCFVIAAALFGIAGGALYLARLLSPPANVILDLWESKAALGLGLAGSLLVVACAGLMWRGRRAAAGRAAAGRAAVGAPRRAVPSDVALVWRAVWSSRVLVWTAGVLGVLKLGTEPSIVVPRIAAPFGYLGNLLTSPATSWDGTAYLTISQYGYGHGPSWLAFFPLYPSVLRAAAFSAKADVIFAIGVSVAAFAGALYLLAKLVELECGRETSELTVLLVAFSPMALFFSAVYTESLFLLLSVASFYCGRRGRWAAAGVLGGLAAATRSTGVVLLVPLAIMYLWGPGASVRSRIRRPGLDVVWLAGVPLGAAAFFAYSGFNGDLLAPLHAVHTYWNRSFTPLLGAVKGIEDAVRSVHQLAVGPGQHVLAVPSYHAGGQLSDPTKLAGADLTDFAFLVFAVIATIGAFRRLPLAYGAYALAMVALTASSYTPFEPLASFPRYLVVVFPCQMWLATWASRASRRHATLLINAGLLAFFAAQFASWRWVA